MKQVIHTVFCLLLLSWSVSPSASASPGWNSATLMHDGLERHFRYYVPATVPENPPVVILLHGGTRSMTKLFRKASGATRAWPELAEEEGFILLTPNGVNEKTGDPQGDRQNWNDCRAPVVNTGAASIADDVGFIDKLITRAILEQNVDESRVYVTGASNGGMMSYRLAIELSNRVAAAAIFIANRPADNECRHTTRPVPMMIVNGTEDPLMPWGGGAIMGGGGDVLSTQETLGYWLRANRTDMPGAQTTLLPDLNKRDKSHVTRTRYPAAPGGAEVLFYKVIGGGHAMPHARYVIPRFMRKILIGNQNRDFDSVRAAWNFLRIQRLNSP